jgi:hypothetical protein
MNTTQDLIKTFGHPFNDRAAFEKKFMILWTVPADIHARIPVLPARLYINRVIAIPLEKVLRQLIKDGTHKEIKTWDGCYNPRSQRGSTAISRHSWGIAVDLNAAWNPLVRGVTPKTRQSLRAKHVHWTEDFLNAWRFNGFACGADWNTVLDGMHMEYIV